MLAHACSCSCSEADTSVEVSDCYDTLICVPTPFDWNCVCSCRYHGSSHIVARRLCCCFRLMLFVLAGWTHKTCCFTALCHVVNTPIVVSKLDWCFIFAVGLFLFNCQTTPREAIRQVSTANDAMWAFTWVRSIASIGVVGGCWHPPMHWAQTTQIPSHIYFSHCLLRSRDEQGTNKC